jgi:hypothetical protein
MLIFCSLMIDAGKHIFLEAGKMIFGAVYGPEVF